MFRLSAKFLVSLGLTLFLLGVLMLAVETGIVPDSVALRLKSRAQLCETVAITTSLFAQRGDIQSIESMLEAICGRDADVLSAGVRRFDSANMIVETSGHSQTWKVATEFRNECRVVVPVYDGPGSKWGVVEIAFTPISAAGLKGFAQGDAVKLMAFVGGLSFIVYYFYLGRMLKVMNAKSVPQRVRTALNTLAGGLIVADANGDIVLANDAVAGWVGHSPETLMGKGIQQLPWVLPEGCALPWDVTFSSQLPIVGETLRIDSTDGPRTLIVNSTPMVGDNENLRGVFIGLEDVTVLEKKEIEHKKLRQEAERANSAKSDFLARMSHEIRTPMNAILGFTDVLRRGFDANASERDEYLNTIHSSGEHLLSLINDILDLSKVESGRMELETTKCSSHKIILETLQVLQVKADEKGLSLRYLPEEGMPEFVESDPVRLRQIVTNIVGNAIKFTEQGGVQVQSRLVGKQLEICVVDSGIGIQKEALARIFSPFSQADTSVTRKFGGTGLGLAIARSFAEAMGGGIRVTSKLGTGTTFIVTIDPGNIDEYRRIPSQEAVQALGVREKSTLNAELPPCKILVVDDGESNRKLLRLYLKRAGATIVEAENGQVAVDLTEQEEFDVILLDMQMPVMDGYTAATTLRQRGCLIPIVALTAHAMTQDEEKCLAAGCSHFLTKPVDSNKLLRLVSDIVGGEVRVVESPSAVEPEPTPASVPPMPPSAPPMVAIPAAVDAPPISSTLPMDDEDFRQIVLEFVKRLDEQLAAMESACTAGDMAELANLAHWLKGSGGTAGFDCFTVPAKQLEDVAKSGLKAEAASAVQSLRVLQQRIQVQGRQNQLLAAGVQV